MKLPKEKDKFVITDESSPCCGNVVSGVHLEVWGDECHSNQLFYYVFVNQAYSGDVISSYGGCLFCSRTLKNALDYVVRCLAPYREPEPETQPAIPGGSSGKGGADGQ